MQKILRWGRLSKCFEWLYCFLLFSLEAWWAQRFALTNFQRAAFCKSRAAIIKHQSLSPSVGRCFKIHTCITFDPWNTCCYALKTRAWKIDSPSDFDYFESNPSGFASPTPILFFLFWGTTQIKRFARWSQLTERKRAPALAPRRSGSSFNDAWGIESLIQWLQQKQMAKADIWKNHKKDARK